MGTGQKALRAVRGSSFKLCESEGRIDRPEHTASGSQNKGTEKLQRRAGPSPREVGGGGGGEGANSAPEKPPPPTQQTGLRFLSKEFLRFWMVDIHRREGRG